MQVKKTEVRHRIVAAAERSFFEAGYGSTTMAGVARAAGVSTSNLYRYFTDKAALFEAVLTDELIAEHDRLLDARIEALTEPLDRSPEAEALLAFWVEHRLAVATLLDHDGDTTRRSYATAFVDRLVAHAARAAGRDLDPTEHAVAEVVFDNTRRAIAALLRLADDEQELRELIEGFWSYQLPGVGGLGGWLDGRRRP